MAPRSPSLAIDREAGQAPAQSPAPAAEPQPSIPVTHNDGP